MNIDDFIKSEKPNPTKAQMGAFKEEIRKLLSLEYSTAQILKFLEANHVKCNKQTLGKFILRHKLRQASPPNPLPPCWFANKRVDWGENTIRNACVSIIAKAY